MIRASLLTLASFAAFAFSSCSSVGVYDLQQRAGASVQTRPSRILVEPFSAQASAFDLGRRSPEDHRVLRGRIVSTLADQTARQLRVYAADATVLQGSRQLVPGTWLVRGQIREVSQGSRALRATIGLGAGQTKMRTRVTVFQVGAHGLTPLISFNTTGSSGLEPGAVLGAAAGGSASVAAGVGLAAGLTLNSLPGVSTDIDRTSYEIAAVVSSYLQSRGLHDPSRRTISPNMKGRLPSTLNTARAVPAPLRSE